MFSFLHSHYNRDGKAGTLWRMVWGASAMAGTPFYWRCNKLSYRAKPKGVYHSPRRRSSSTGYHRGKKGPQHNTNLARPFVEDRKKNARAFEEERIREVIDDNLIDAKTDSSKELTGLSRNPKKVGNQTESKALDVMAKGDAADKDKLTKISEKLS